MNATAEYLREMAQQLARIAAGAGYRTAAHLFDMAALDMARTIAREADRVAAERERATGV